MRRRWILKEACFAGVACQIKHFPVRHRSTDSVAVLWVDDVRRPAGVFSQLLMEQDCTLNLNTSTCDYIFFPVTNLQWKVIVRGSRILCWPTLPRHALVLAWTTGGQPSWCTRFNQTGRMAYADRVYYLSTSHSPAATILFFCCCCWVLYQWSELMCQTTLLFLQYISNSYV